MNNKEYTPSQEFITGKTKYKFIKTSRTNSKGGVTSEPTYYYEIIEGLNKGGIEPMTKGNIEFLIKY